jgi:flagellin
MAQTINTNIPSLNAQRNLNTSQSALATSLQRLSSGLRINSAKDDAAGLAISDRMTSQIRGLNQAARNANDGVSLAQTAEGGLAEVSNNLQRIRELAVQSANSTNSSADRTSLNAEVTQLLAEIQRVATTSQFNGQNILDGTFAASQFQVGANANQTITASTGNAQTTAIGAYQYNNTTTAVSGAVLAAGDLTINGIDVGATPATTYGYATDIVTAINSKTSSTGVSATAVSTLAAVNVPTRKQDLASGDLVINGINIGAVTGAFAVATQGTSVAAAINLKTAQTGVTATSNASTGAITLSSSTGRTIAVTTSNGTSGASHVENATGLELSSGQAAATNIADFAGTKGTSTLTFTAAAIAGDSITVNGQTYTFAAAADVPNNVVAYGGSATASAANLATAITNKETALGTASRITAAGALGVLTITSAYATKDTAHTTITEVSDTGTNMVAAAGVAGAGVGLGDTLTVGGVTYSFGYANTAAVSGTTAVTIGDTDVATGLAFTNAINNNNSAVLTNISAANGAAGAVTLTSQNLGAQGTLDVVDTASVPTGVAFTTPLLGTVGTAAADNTVHGIISLSSDTAYSVSGAHPTFAGLQNASSTLNTISSVDISTVAGANSAISLIDGALSQVSTIRGSMGALQNRFQSVVSSLTASSENLSAARSRIQDTDYAAETAALTRNQILQQAGVAMLAQANALPNTVLSLLK